MTMKEFCEKFNVTEEEALLLVDFFTAIRIMRNLDKLQKLQSLLNSVL